mmetsp:Transcript_6829/g.22109  ORF Transcript_6829/g.22109 Transcript_6829/m.22109 type:complete len:217 (+) Transcript_6829:594-1244(+)
MERRESHAIYSPGTTILGEDQVVRWVPRPHEDRWLPFRRLGAARPREAPGALRRRVRGLGLRRLCGCGRQGGHPQRGPRRLRNRAAQRHVVLLLRALPHAPRRRDAAVLGHVAAPARRRDGLCGGQPAVPLPKGSQAAGQVLRLGPGRRRRRAGRPRRRRRRLGRWRAALVPRFGAQFLDTRRLCLPPLAYFCAPRDARRHFDAPPGDADGSRLRL